MVDRAEHRGRVVGVHEGAGAVVDRLAGDRGIVGVHHAVDEADEQPAGDEIGLARDHRVQQRAIGLLRRRGLGVVAGDHIVGQQAQRLGIAPRGEDTGTCRRGCGSRPRASGRRRAASSRVAPARRSSPRPARAWSGTPSAAMASLTMYSRSTGPSAARPSPPREKGVGPEPLSWMSRRTPSGPTTSPSRMARPSPSCGTKWPNWCPA